MKDERKSFAACVVNNYILDKGGFMAKRVNGVEKNSLELVHFNGFVRNNAWHKNDNMKSDSQFNVLRVESNFDNAISDKSFVRMNAH